MSSRGAIFIVLVGHLAVTAMGGHGNSGGNGNGNGNGSGSTGSSSTTTTTTDTCTDFLNNGVRNCCPTTGMCQDSSCTVFGFPNSARANCHVKGANPNCAESYCNWKVATCPESDSVHCYGTVACVDGSNRCYGYGELCLEDGNSDNFKICAEECKNNNDCPSGSTCNKRVSPAICEQDSPAPSDSPFPSPASSNSASGSQDVIQGDATADTVVDTNPVVEDVIQGDAAANTVDTNQVVEDVIQGDAAANTVDTNQVVEDVVIQGDATANVVVDSTPAQDCGLLEGMVPTDFEAFHSGAVPSCDINEALALLGPKYGCQRQSPTCQFLQCTETIPEAVLGDLRRGIC